MNKVRAFLMFVWIGATAQAHVPDAGQILRIQPQMLRNEKAFVAKGSVAALGKTMPATLEVFGPGTYRYTIRDIPKEAYADGEGSSSWQITRIRRKGVLKTDTLTAELPPPGIWAAFELSGSPEEASQSFIEAGLMRREDATYKETDSRTIEAGNAPPPSARPAIGANGTTPWAVLEIRGPSYTPPEDDNHDAFPVLHFDPTFLNLLTVRLQRDSELITMQALADLSLSDRKTRFSYILANRVEVLAGRTPRAVFHREEPTATSAAGTPSALPKALIDVGTLRDKLSVEGQQFLSAVLLLN